MADHASATDPEIHEPKGIASAGANRVYVADGNGSGSWEPLPSANPDLIKAPFGSMANFVGTSAPTKWFLCYGQAVSRTTYSDLFTAIGTVYGAGDGTTTFNLPDCRGRVTAGKDNMGGSSADRLTNLSGGVNGDILGATGGAQSVTLTSAQVPELTGTAESAGSHTHSMGNDNNVLRYNSGTTLDPTSTASTDSYDDRNLSVTSAGDHAHTVTVNSTGGGSHSNIQPTIIFTKIIYHGVE